MRGLEVGNIIQLVKEAQKWNDKAFLQLFKEYENDIYRTAFVYVKNQEERFVVRGDKVMKVNQPIIAFMNDAILNPLHLIDIRFTELLDFIGKNYLDLKERIEGKK